MMVTDLSALPALIERLSDRCASIGPGFKGSMPISLSVASLEKLLAAARLALRQAPVIERLLADCRTEQLCWLCGYVIREDGSVQEHGAKCPLVVGGFISREGERL
jgi:hypothetical protein